MSSNFANLRIGTRLLILTPLLGIEYYVFQLPFDLLPLIVIMACATSVLLEYKVIHITLSKQPNEPARQLLIRKMNRFGQGVLLGGFTFMILAQFEETPEQIYESVRVGSTMYLSGLTIIVSVILGYSRHRAYQAELTKSSK